MGGLTALFRTSGGLLGTAMGVAAAGALVAEIVFAVEDSENIAGLSLVNTPELDAASIEEASMKYREKGYTEVGYINGHEFQATTPSGKHVIVSQKGHKWVQHAAHGGGQSAHHHKPRVNKRTAQRLETAPRLQQGGGHGSSGRPIHVHVHLKNKEIAEAVTTEALDEAALQ
jgi:hypothetical protein